MEHLSRKKKQERKKPAKRTVNIPPMDDQMYEIAQCLLEKIPISQLPN
jgi:hypothetical protein